MNKKPANLKYIESTFADIMVGEDKGACLKTIQRFLERQFGFKINKLFINDNTSGEVYGMSIMPNSESIQRLARFIQTDIIDIDEKEMRTELTKAINNIEYIIEIDSKILFNKIYKLSASEITAMLIHEIGHLVIDRDVYYNIMNTYLITIKQLKLNLSDAIKGDYATSILAVINSITRENMSNRIKNFEIESQCDNFAASLGYGKDLESALNKFSKFYGKPIKYKGDRNKAKDMVTETETYIKLSNIPINERRKIIRDTYSNKITPQFNLKKLYEDIIERAKGKYNEKNNIAPRRNILNKLMNKSIDDSGEIINLDEGLLDIFKKPKVTEQDIDEIRIELEMVKDYDDKMILMYKIHKKLDKLEKVNKKLSNDDLDKKNMIKQYKDRLNELLEKTMALKITPKKYGVFVQYPTGYEG